jgi:dihydropteridine reductase
MVKSLSSKKGGLPDGSVTVGIAPVMLDTPANRESMPDADRSTWTPVEDVAEKIFEWSSRSGEMPTSGKVYKIVTIGNKTDFIIL